ncbi:hypothetical protein Mlab_1419 [Methanocorpusculum labreanum Z]|uniref:Uncharacterized protein n=1 Tax=Methanocorpusculum labreanum (strain ATCC 43576 / DSM 4855 / Z) TaxID=410358 RepID=A2STC9_METLZ|nr:DUF5803 family protein [Methanocorpusculum labreanum]ABN07585.1 hypothetical protein Mlab_1419 [Methanocorpusculum labreanum Z]
MVLLALFAVPAAANSAVYFVSDDGTVLTANATLINQSTFLLVKPGFLGEEVALSVDNLTIQNESGVVEYTQNGKTVSFPAGNYTLNYSAKIENGLVYLKYPEPYNVSVYLPERFQTGHLILGTVGTGGVVSSSDNSSYGSMVTFENTTTASFTFYDDVREPLLYIFLGIWGVVFIIAGIRYLRLKRKPMKDF